MQVIKKNGMQVECFSSFYRVRSQNVYKKRLKRCYFSGFAEADSITS
jgi:hypothetical protein